MGEAEMWKYCHRISHIIPFTIQREVPNADTMAAMKEADDMMNHPERYETFHSMDEMKKALEA